MKTDASWNRTQLAEVDAADASEGLHPRFLREHGRPDVLIIDPPRMGLGETLLRAVIKVKPDRIVYVSCNPATQARDLAALQIAYRIEAVQPVDMFPHTYHIENVTALQRT